MCGLKWEKIFILKSLKHHHCAFPKKKKKCIASFENLTVSVLIESDSFVIISSSNNFCVAFFPLIIHCVLIYILISVSLTQNCQARMIPSHTTDCELLILSSCMSSSVPYADGAPPQNLCFLVFEGPRVCHRYCGLKQDLRICGFVCSLSLRNRRYLTC